MSWQRQRKKIWKTVDWFLLLQFYFHDFLPSHSEGNLMTIDDDTYVCVCECLKKTPEIDENEQWKKKSKILDLFLCFPSSTFSLCILNAWIKYSKIDLAFIPSLEFFSVFGYVVKSIVRIENGKDLFCSIAKLINFCGFNGQTEKGPFLVRLIELRLILFRCTKNQFVIVYE